ncbi:ABC transporter permease [Amycolatopsis sp. NPDC051903]|uniref:ABC transporter permease n=1 Tax=Amycolatopsis sp. NPDC051903 TaxID=3363936 RepID=UPI00379D5E93
MPAVTKRPVGVFALFAALVGTLAAVVLGFLTFGAQATVAPDHVPVAVSAPPGPLQGLAHQLAGHGGTQLDWRVTDPGQARNLLADKEVYGVLELREGPAATVVLSGAVNPAGTQVAQQALAGAAQALPGEPQLEQLHPASPAGRIVPLAASALAWLGSLVAGAVLVRLGAGRRISVPVRLAQVLGAGVLVTGVLAGFTALWDATLPLTWDVLGFLFLTVTAFAALQAGLLRLLGIKALAVLAPLYLVAPAVAGQVPELLDPVYRALLWSWTPFRFSTEGLRSLLQGVPGAPDVTTGVWVLAALLVAGLAVVLWPGRSAREEAEADLPHRVVDVGVH